MGLNIDVASPPTAIVIAKVSPFLTLRIVTPDTANILSQG